MRTTLTIRDDVYRRVRIRAAEDGTTVTSVVERALLLLLQEADATGGPFRLRPFAHMGAPEGVDLHDNSAVLDRLDEDTPAAARR